MYLEHFGLRDFPFSLAPDPRYLYLSGQHREALAHLLYGVRSEGGFVQITGEVGTGKTTVCRCFLEQLPPGTQAAVILNPALAAEDLFAAICDEFEIPLPEGPAGAKATLERIHRFLLDVHAAGERAVLVIDEAQNLDPGVLEQVRLLTNLETSRHKLLQIILMGQPELRATLGRPDLRQLAQRITARFHLRPLSRGETAAYVRHRLEVAGCHEELFPPPVIGRLRSLSRGVPRLVNILCDRALLGAFVQGRRQVDRATLAQAAREVAGETGAPALSRRRLLLAGAAIAAAAAIFYAAIDRPWVIPGPSATPASMPAAGSTAGTRRVDSVPREVSPTVSAPSPDTARAPSPGRTSPGVGDVPAGSIPPVSGVLRALTEQPEAQGEEEAWRWLYRLWGIRVREGENGCTQAPVHGLECLRGDGGLEQLRRLDRPAIVRVFDARGAARWLVLERLQERQAAFAAGGAKTVVDTDKLEGYGIREYTLLWRPPDGTRGALVAGDRGPGVAWVARRLAAVSSAPVPAAGGGGFDEPLVAALRDFQRERGLEADGVAGPETLILLDAEPAPGTPTLARRP